MEKPELKKAVESLLFITDHPIPASKIAEIVGEKEADNISAVVDELRQEYDAQDRGMRVVEIAEGYQMATRPEGASFVRKLYADKMVMRLSAAALETLSIIAYKQPLTRAEIEEVRGVEVIAALESLLDKRLVKVVGRKETVGRPLLYGTSPDFLRHFGLRSIEDLPPLDSFKIPDPSPEAAGSASAAPEESPMESPEAAGASASTDPELPANPSNGVLSEDVAGDAEGLSGPEVVAEVAAESSPEIAPVENTSVEASEAESSQSPVPESVEN